jgi:hypothetical protein
MNDTHNKEQEQQPANDAFSEAVQNENEELSGQVTRTPPDHTKALACVLVSGLSVLCFNPVDNRAEIGFMRPHHNLLEMEIFKNGCSPFWSSKTDFEHSMNNVGITINKTKTGMGRREEDFDYMPDLAKLHKVRGFEPQPNRGAAFSARVDIHDAIFYTHKMSENKVWRHEILDSGSSSKTDIQRIGRILGADIVTSESIIIEIRYRDSGGVIQTFPVPPLLNDGSKYSIVLRTLPHDHGDTGAGHIKLIYDNVIKKPPGSPRYDFEYYPGPEPGWSFCDVKGRSTQYACENVGGGEGPLPVYPPGGTIP